MSSMLSDHGIKRLTVISSSKPITGQPFSSLVSRRGGPLAGPDSTELVLTPLRLQDLSIWLSADHE
jgi:hypothetical protein